MSDAASSSMLVRTDRVGHVATVTLTRADKLNALSRPMLEAIRAAFEALNEHPPRAVLLAAEGKAFVAGADISEMSKMGPKEAAALSNYGHEVMDTIEQFAAPVIAVVHGFALGGGCELALACDFIVAGRRAKFGQPEVKLGLIPGFGGTKRLQSRVGAARARELIYTGRIVDAEEAKSMGLANHVFEDDALRSEAASLAEAIAKQGPAAVASAKRAMAAHDHGAERSCFADCFGTDEQQEGVTAFQEKRAPRF